MSTNFPELRDHLQNVIRSIGREIPGPIGGFATLHKNAVAEGALPAKTKELAALGIAIAARCEGCIAFHVHDALAAGATRDEVVEIIGVAVLMGGGPALMYGADAYDALDQFATLP